MSASKPARLLSLAIVALVVLVGVRGIVGGTGSSGDLFDGAGAHSVAAGKRTPGVVAYVFEATRAALRAETTKLTTEREILQRAA